MAKPSIFSSNYEQKMKQRRKKIVFLIILCIIIILSIIFFIRKNLKGWDKKSPRKKFNIEFSDKYKDKKQSKDKNDVATKNKTPEAEVKKEEDIKKEEKFDINIGNINMSAVYEVENNKKIFKELQGAGSNINYDINPSGNLMVICENASGILIVANTDNKVIDITKPNYSSTSGKVFSREDIIKIKQGYNWCNTPVFIDNENIVYLSSLPWFDGRDIQYVWMANVNTKDHINILGLEGKDIKFNELSDNGLSVTIDNKNLILNKDGVVR